MNNYEKAKIILKKYDQQQILEIMEKIDKNKKEIMSQEILDIDFEEITNLYNKRDEKSNIKNNIEPIKCIDKNKLSIIEQKELSKIGEKIIKNNQYAVVTMAGGQGTRLGWNGPKGTYKLSINQKEKYIFEILLETLKRAKEEFGIEVLWYIMTSEENNDETIKFFEQNKYFGYDKEKIKFFKQDTCPLINEDGKILVDNKFHIKEASNGNGGVFKALRKSKMIDDMKLKGIKWVYICGVDNIMANMVDPLLLGLTVENNQSLASKSVKKAYPEEKVGIFCKKNGKPAIIEYTEMTDEMIHSRDEEGDLIYGESNIISHLFNIEAIEKLANYTLKYHYAKKKNSYINENLQEVIPDVPNTYKFETFIFDAFQYLDDMMILSVNRNEEFSPIKNASGVDSPETAKKIYEEYFQNKEYEEQVKISNLYNLDETIAKQLLEENEYPWECLTKINNFIIELGNKLDKDKFEKFGENIWIAKNANIAKTASITGPVIIDENAEIRHGAYIRGRVIVGKNSVIGSSVELKNCIIFNDVQIPHYSYVGDSILGYKAHMGAGSIVSNLKSDKTDVTINTTLKRFSTNLRKVGVMIGDNVEIGCNAVLNPGTVIGRNTTIYPLSNVRGVILENSIYKNSDNIIKKKNPV